MKKTNKTRYQMDLRLTVLVLPVCLALAVNASGQQDVDEMAVAPYAIPQLEVLTENPRGLCVCQDETSDKGRAGLLTYGRGLYGQGVHVRCELVEYDLNGDRSSVSPCENWEALTGQMPLVNADKRAEIGESCKDNAECKSGFCLNKMCTVPIFGGFVTNEVDPRFPGLGVDGGWSIGGLEGIAAGNAMCGVAGHDHVCTYEELQSAEIQGSTSLMPSSVPFWLHRVNVTVDVGGLLVPPGPGGRCTDNCTTSGDPSTCTTPAALEDSWRTGTNHASDGEYGMKDGDGVLTFAFDDDTAWTGNPADGHADNFLPPFLKCSVSRAIPCCNAVP